MQRPPVRVIKVGDSLALIIPAPVCRDLKIRRGDFFDLLIGDSETIVARRLKVVAEDKFEGARDSDLPIINHE